jgi:hypothetical protein
MTDSARARRISDLIEESVYGPRGAETPPCANAWEVSKLIASLEARLEALEAIPQPPISMAQAPESATKEQSSPWRDPRLYPKEISDGQYIEAARLAVQYLGHISIAETPYVERTDDDLGAYVSAQIWVPKWHGTSSLITNSTP